MPNWNGPVPGRKDARTRTKGAMRELRAQKRAEAEARQAEYLANLSPVQVQVEISL